MKQILVILALACFLIAAFGFQIGYVGLVPLGLFLWVLSSLV